jgi:hypothetical protein
MIEMFKLTVILKWVGIYIAAWIFEEIVLWLVVTWIFGPKDTDEPQDESITSTT